MSVDPKRSWTMSRVKSKHTTPELLVRKTLRVLNYRYRLHSRDLPGKPDIVFRKKKKVIFVHGCFWHRHNDPRCKLTRTPKSNIDFWKNKFDANTARDQNNIAALLNSGWSILIIWECELSDIDMLKNTLSVFLR